MCVRCVCVVGVGVWAWVYVSKLYIYRTHYMIHNVNITTLDI